MCRPLAGRALHILMLLPLGLGVLVVGDLLAVRLGFVRHRGVPAGEARTRTGHTHTHTDGGGNGFCISAFFSSSLSFIL